MRTRLRDAFAPAVAAAITALPCLVCVACARPEAAAKAPEDSSTVSSASAIDLSHFKLQIPGPAEVPSSELVAGYSSRYFHLEPETGARLLALDAAETGSTTNSDYVRSELREQMTPGKDAPNWVTGTHVLTETIALRGSTLSPNTVTVAQIHGYGGSGADPGPLLRVTIE